MQNYTGRRGISNVFFPFDDQGTIEPGPRGKARVQAPADGRERFSLRQHAATHGIRRRFCTVCATGFGEDVAHMRGHGIETDAQGISNFLVALTGGDEAQHVHLVWAQIIDVK